MRVLTIDEQQAGEKQEKKTSNKHITNGVP
jgi:hypothetical protein